MNDQTQVALELRPCVEIINGQIKTTSLKIAEHFGKRHDTVLRAIKNLDCSPEFTLRNFAECSRINELANGKPEPYYEMTRDGFTFLAMGFTGKEAAKWKESYINAFNVMADELHQQSNIGQLPDPKTKKALPGGLTLEQQDTIKALVKSRAEELPKEKQAGATIKQWGAIKKKFGLTKNQTYKEISPDNFVSIISLLSRLPLEGELLPKLQTNSITLTFEGDEPQKLLVSVSPLGTQITKLLPDEMVIKKGQFYIMERKDKVSAGKLVLDYIPAEFLPYMIEVAGQRLGRINAGKKLD